MVAARVTKNSSLILYGYDAGSAVTKITTMVLSGLEETTAPSSVTKITTMVLSRKPPHITQAMVTGAHPR